MVCEKAFMSVDPKKGLLREKPSKAAEELPTTFRWVLVGLIEAILSKVFP